jgi:AcrR family transcriptional regulator
MVGPMSRATPLPAAERRSEILAATERLLVERGQAVSTREIAEAAGIAEGTIFRVFATKDAIIEALFEDAFDARADWEKLRAVDGAKGLEACLVELVEMLQRRIRRVMALFAAVGFRQPQANPEILEQRRLGYEAIAELLRPHAARLRSSPEDAARHLHGVALALTHPMLTDRPIHDAREIVDLALNGIARQKGQGS